MLRHVLIVINAVVVFAAGLVSVAFRFIGSAGNSGCKITESFVFHDSNTNVTTLAGMRFGISAGF